MDAVKYIKERARMCKAVKCFECKLSVRFNMTEYTCRDFVDLFPEKAVAIVEKWAEEHPQKTMLQDLLEKYPDTPLNGNGIPIDICPHQIGFAEYMECLLVEKCIECWNRPLESD